jgi:hypothetical protein
VFDARDFPDLGSALWYTLQTVTTVGYGDHVPTSAVGRVVGASVMVVAVALIAILDRPPPDAPVTVSRWSTPPDCHGTRVEAVRLAGRSVGPAHRSR